MIRAELAEEIAEIIGIDSYDPHREKQGSADFRRDEIAQIYQAVTGESSEGLTQREMNYIMMRELGTELQAAYPYDLGRSDLKVIHRYLIENSLD